MTRPGRHPARREGFTISELLIILAVSSVLAGISLPTIGSAVREYRLNSSTRQVIAEISAARFAAVAKNLTLRVRFNCPGPGQFRVVEVTGVAAIDNDADRCSEAVYPYPDPNPNAAPNGDGPAMWLSDGAAFPAAQDIQLSTRGRV
ncbi:MAG: hypothetical protein QF681_01220 [Vicinamibacterales bacterium]|nr:hypothetical protein [Vicinamibacterales bacterium]